MQHIAKTMQVFHGYGIENFRSMLFYITVLIYGESSGRSDLNFPKLKLLTALLYYLVHFHSHHILMGSQVRERAQRQDRVKETGLEVAEMVQMERCRPGKD